VIFSALVLAMGAAAAISRTGGTPAFGAWAKAVSGLLITTPLAWRRRLPLIAVLAQLGGLVVMDGDILAPPFFALMIGIYSVAAHHRSRWVSLAVLLAAATGFSATYRNAIPHLPSVLTSFALVVPLWLMGGQVGRWRAHAGMLTSRADRLERDREAATRAAIAEERSRIARELHDVVTHNVSVIVIQATAARQVMDTEPQFAYNAMGAIERVGQQAMSELRQMLDLLGDTAETGGGQVPPCPQTGLGQLNALLTHVRAAGLPVTARQTGVTRPLPPGVDLAAYRIVQEALTNVLRHAPHARTAVHLDYSQADLTIEVTNATGRPAANSGPSAAGGRGLAGLRERVRFYGGELAAGARPGGGYRLYARIPLDAS
jgi:signal transduction histidine kinase